MINTLAREGASNFHEYLQTQLSQDGYPTKVIIFANNNNITSI